MTTRFSCRERGSGCVPCTSLRRRTLQPHRADRRWIFSIRSAGVGFCPRRLAATPHRTKNHNEFKVDSATGFVKNTHGVSVFDNADSVLSKGFVPHKVDQSSIPDSLRVIQRGSDPRHFEITPKPSTNLTPQQFIDACGSISCIK